MEKKIQGTFIAIRRLSLLLMLITTVMPTEATAEDYCCEFETADLCAWQNRGLYWKWSGQVSPNTTGIDNFNTTDPSEFEWLQSTPNGDATLISTRVTLDENDTISIERYRLTPIPLNKFTVWFTRLEDFNQQSIFNDFSTTGWLNQSVTCGPKTPCCINYPCEGWFTADAKLTSNELVAFKHFLINGCPIGTTTPLPPTEPPSDADVLCNRFQTSNADWVLENWDWSQALTPDWTGIPEFTYDSDYAWSQYEGAKLTSPPVIIDDGSEISFDYYVYSSIVDIGNSLIVYFHDTDVDKLNPLTMLQDTKGNWTAAVAQCSSFTPCCNVYPCSGKLIWEVTIASGSTVLYAVDNLQLNKGCTNTPTCCEFEASSICEMNSSNSMNVTADGWIWSGDQEPVLTVPTSDGYYVWREDTNGDQGPVTAKLQSQLVTLYPNSSVNFSYYVNVGAGGINRMYIRFHRQIDDNEIAMDYMSVNSTTWIPYNVKCQSAHSSCCGDEKGCAGWIEFTTLSDGTSPVIFAIDNLQLDSQCNA